MLGGPSMCDPISMPVRCVNPWDAELSSALLQEFDSMPQLAIRPPTPFLSKFFPKGCQLGTWGGEGTQDAV